MPKFVAAEVINKAFTEIALCNQIDVVSDTLLPGNVANSLARGVLTPGAPAGDFTIAPVAGGNQLTVKQKTDIPITVSGEARHIVVSFNGAIKLVTSCQQQALTSGGKVTIPAFTDLIADPQ